MVQLGLQLQERLPYDGKKFLSHHGVNAVITDATAAVQAQGFSSRFYVGPARSGKTHGTLAIGELLSSAGKTTRFLDGATLGRWLKESFPTVTLHEIDSFLIDDADKYFSNIQPGDSGPFVTFYESLRRVGAKLFLFSGIDADIFNVDEHCMSRIRASVGPNFEAPDEEDLEGLVQAMARQRGIGLKEKKLGFISRRVGRDIPAIEGYLQRVLHLSQLFGTKIKYPLLNDAV